MKLYGLDSFEITHNFIPGELEPFCLQSLLEGALQIEGKEVTKDVALDPAFSAMKDRTNLGHAFQRKNILHAKPATINKYCLSGNIV